jgi:GNAT superfamily N-acetyltransferase
MWLLRTATPADQAFMDGLHAAVLRQSWGLPEGMPDLAMDAVIAAQCRWREAAYRRTHSPDGCRLICHTDGAPVGRLWTALGDTLHLVDLAVLPSMQHRGIGRWALLELQQQARTLGLPLTLQVAADNPARHLYLRLGWCVTGQASQDLQMTWTPADSLAPTD